MTTFNAYHFTGSHLRDGCPVPSIGEPLIHTGPIEWCKSGLYASRTAWDALCYAPGPILHRVLCEDIEIHGCDKLVCRRRTIIATIDATNLLRRFAADQALSVSHLWDMPDVVRDYLTTLDEYKRDAAWRSARYSMDVAESAAADGVALAAAAAWAATWADDKSVTAAENAWVYARDAAYLDTAKATADFNARVDAAFAAS